MERQTSTWGRSRKKIRRTERWIEGLWILGLLLASLLLFGTNLDYPPSASLGEGTVSEVASEIVKAPLDTWQWLYPTLSGKPDHDEPPLLHFLIAGAYKMAGINPWTRRLPGAILSAVSVPLLYGIGREIFPGRQGAIFSSLIYLTLLPVIHYGRLATVDGASLCFVMLMMWCVLRSRRDFRWSLGVGLGFGLICLTKGLLLGFLLGAIALLYLTWDTPRLLTSGYWWLGLLLGSLPAGAWYTGAAWQYGQTFLTTDIVSSSLRPFWTAMNKNSSRPPWYYLVEIFKYSSPWLLFFPYGLHLAWKNRNWGWAKLVLVWTSVYLLVISLVFTELSGLVLPIYPALALAGGAQFAEVWNWPSRQSYPRIWNIGLILLALGAIAGSVYFGIINATDWSLSIIFASVALTMITSAFLMARRDLQFILILFWGMYISLLLLVSSSHWTGEFLVT